jgi:hypothetical protein
LRKTVNERIALYLLKILCSTKCAHKQLIEARFEYVAERDGFKIYRKRG